MFNEHKKRTMVYSNVNNKAEKKSASKKSDVINLDDEIIIGLKRVPEPKENKKKNHEKMGQVKKKLTREEQKKRVIRKILLFLFFIVLLVVGIIYLMLSPMFNIKSIEVINNCYINSNEIIQTSGIQINQNTFKFSKKEVKNKILLNPYIEDIDIHRDLINNSVKIDIKERIATLMLEYGNSYVYINNQGYILEISNEKIEAPILKGYKTALEEIKVGNRLNKEDLERLDMVLNIIEVAESNNIDKLITQIDIKDKNEYILYMFSEDKTIYLGKCSNLSTQMLYIKEMLEREKGIEGEFFVDMDLNISNPVFREKV
ncbi:MAG: FtsQ-type POTRA domain-containing protein [Clostridiales bacterium]|nr:FtsQ-type POTRA domain-containing protein [Clostridiales bacterium]